MKTLTMKSTICLITFILVIALKAQTQSATNFLAMSSTKLNGILIDVDFNTTISKNTGTLNWKTISTIDVIRYELEKSTDGEHFSYVTAVAATINSSNQYNISDNNLSDGINYYRLKIVDNNGKLFYSKPVSIDKNLSAAKYKIMPNIVADEILIWLPVNVQVSNATIKDIVGRVVIQNTPINNRTCLATIKVADLQTGIYLITVVTTDGATTNLSFSKK